MNLIKRLESATEGSRELDTRIHILLFDPDVMIDGGGYGPNARPAEYAKASTVFTDTWTDWDGAAMQVNAPIIRPA